MKKINFKIRTKAPLGLRYLQFLFESLIGLALMGLTLWLCFLGLEAYFSAYYKNSANTPQTVMNLPIYQESSYRSWDHKPMAHAIHGFGTPTPEININSLGLRNPEIPAEKTNRRYLLLGDSFTFGMGVSEENTFPARLQKFFGNKYHTVMNAGVIGQSIDDAFLYLKNEGIKLQPDFVIYNFFVGNDITELRRHNWTTDDAGSISKTEDTVLKVNENNQLRFRNQKEPDSYFLFWLKQKIQILKLKYAPEQMNDAIDPTLTWPVFLSYEHPLQDPNIDEYWLRFETVLKQMNEYCKNHNITFVVTIIPMDVQVSKAYEDKYPGSPFNDEAFEAQRPQKRMKLLAEKYNIKMLDLLPIFQQVEKDNNERLYFENDPHYNILGHRFMASSLWQFLMDNFLRK